MFNLFSRLFNTASGSREYIVFAMRRTLPPSSQRVYGTFKVRAKSEYEAARTFDQTYTAWSRLTVEKD